MILYKAGATILFGGGKIDARYIQIDFKNEETTKWY